MTELIIVLILLTLSFGCEKLAERNHFANLDLRESGNGTFLVTQLKSFPSYESENISPQIVVAKTIVATDYFKSFLARLRWLFGGEVRSFHSLLERARRETTQRLIEQAQELGYNAICNLRLISADVGGSTASKKGAAMVAILGSATAYHYDAPAV